MRHRRKITREKMLEAVKKYFNDEGSKTTIANEYGISFSLFRAWVARYPYPSEQIIQIVSLYLC